MNRSRTLWLLIILLMTSFLVFSSKFVVLSASKKTVAEEPQYGGTLTLADRWTARGYDPISWNVADWNWLQTWPTGFVMEGLIAGDIDKYGPRGSSQYDFSNWDGATYDLLKGKLVDSWKFNDPLTLEFHVRQGVMWQNNPRIMKQPRALTADDIVFCLNRLVNEPKLRSRFDFWVDSISAPAKDKVILKFKKYYADWPSVLGYYHFTQIYAPESAAPGVDASDYRNQVGTGPFIIDKYIPGSIRVYKRNPNYWGTTVINGKTYKLPFIDELRVPVMPDESTRIAALRTGKIDINTEVSWRDRTSLIKTNPDLTMTRCLTTSPNAYAMRMDKKPFNDIKVRWAMNLAVDKKAMLNSLLGGDGELLNMPVFKAWKAAYTPLNQLPPETQELLTYNPEKAKMLLKEAGYPNGFKTNMLLGSLDMATGYPEMVVDYLKRVGIDCQLKVVDEATRLSMYYGKSWDQIAVGVLGASTPAMLLRKYYSSETAKVNSTSLSMMSDEKFDSLLDKASASRDPKEQMRLAKEANLRLLELVPDIILPQGYIYQTRWPWVKNYYGEISSSTTNMSDIVARMWIDQKLKKKMAR
jgi:peptide/nickel transport system substrate-binding protein